MRLFRCLPFLGLAFMLVVTACQKDTVTPIGSFTFRVDSSKYNFNGGDATMFDTLGKKALQVRGVTNNFAQNAILLVLLDSANVKPGTYNGSMIFSDSILTSEYASTWIGDSVSVNLTSLSASHAVGTFSGKLFQNEKSKELSSGSFNVNY